MNNIEIIASGDKWIGDGIIPTMSAITELIDNSEDSLIMTIYVLTSDLIFDKIHSALKRGVEIEIFIYFNEDYLNLINKLKKLSDSYNYCKIHILDEEFIHSKIIISDRSKLLIGSANFSRRAFFSNYELGVFIDDSHIAFELEKVIKRLL